MVDFTQMLDTNTDTIEKPPVQPQGGYIWSVSKVPTQSTTKSGEWFIVEFPVQAVAAEEDVDPDELEEFGDVSSARNRVAFMFPTDPDKEADRKKSMYRLKQFLTVTLAIEEESDDTLNMLLARSVHSQFLGQAAWRTDGDDTYVDIKSMAPLD